jgi:calcineurin-like phosphoesterase family protein
MIHDKFAIGCTHFFHTNTWKLFKREDGTPLRPFTSTHEMNETMIRNWNSVVSASANVYHVGDVTVREFGPAFIELMHRLNGRKRLLVGNHDPLYGQKNDALRKCFEKIEFWKGFKEYNFMMSHVPLPREHFRGGVKFNVHAHIHYRKKEDPHYINTCVEVRDYTPTSFDTIIEEIKQVQS